MEKNSDFGSSYFMHKICLMDKFMTSSLNFMYKRVNYEWYYSEKVLDKDLYGFDQLY
jgi:hypothetical protein